MARQPKHKILRYLIRVKVDDTLPKEVDALREQVPTKDGWHYTPELKLTFALVWPPSEAEREVGVAAEPDDIEGIERRVNNAMQVLMEEIVAAVGEHSMFFAAVPIVAPPSLTLIHTPDDWCRGCGRVASTRGFELKDGFCPTCWRKYGPGAGKLVLPGDL